MIWFVALLWGCLAVNADYFEGKVVLLKENNYRRALLDFEVVVMAFQSSECNVTRGCTGDFKKYFDRAAPLLQKAIEKRNLSIHVQFCRLMHEDVPIAFNDLVVDAVPAVRIYRQGVDLGYGIDDLFDFNEPEELVSWVLEKLTPLEPTSPAKFRSDRNYIVLVGCSHDSAAELNATRLRDNHNEYICTNERLINEVNYQDGTILFMLNGYVLRQYNEHDGPLFDWVRRYERKDIRKLDNYTIHLIFAQRYPTFLLLTHLDEDSDEAKQEFIRLARQHIDSKDPLKNRILFVHSHVEDNLQQHVEMRTFIGTQDLKYPYPHLSYLQVAENFTLTKYHLEVFKAERMRQWIVSVLEGKEQPFTKSENFKKELDKEKVFESVSLRNLQAILQEDPHKHLVLFIRSIYADQQMLDLRWVAQQVEFPQDYLNSFLKFSHTENDLLPGMHVESLPQLVHIHDGRYTYLEKEHTRENMLEWLSAQVKEHWPVIEKPTEQPANNDLEERHHLEGESIEENAKEL